jgi:hypothetical protein
MRVNAFRAVLLRRFPRDEKRMELSATTPFPRLGESNGDRFHHRKGKSIGPCYSHRTFYKPKHLRLPFRHVIHFFLEYSLVSVSGRVTVLHRPWENITNNYRSSMHIIICTGFVLYLSALEFTTFNIKKKTVELSPPPPVLHPLFCLVDSRRNNWPFHLMVISWTNPVLRKCHFIILRTFFGSIIFSVQLSFLFFCVSIFTAHVDRAQRQGPSGTIHGWHVDGRHGESWSHVEDLGPAV